MLNKKSTLKAFQVMPFLAFPENTPCPVNLSQALSAPETQLNYFPCVGNNECHVRFHAHLLRVDAAPHGPSGNVVFAGFLQAL